MTIYPIIGVSPDNSYFKYETIKNLLKKSIDKYGRVAVFVADVPATFTYMALGYPENVARRDKAVPKGNNLKNKFKKAIEEIGYSAEQVKIIDWKNEIENNPRYQEKYGEVLNLYKSNNAFQQEADLTTQEVLKNEFDDEPKLKEAVKVAVNYLLSEFAFMEFACEYLGADKAVYIYHKNWKVYEDYLAGKFDNKPRNYLGFEIIDNLN